MLYLWGNPGFIRTKAVLDPKSPDLCEQDASRLRQRHLKHFRKECQGNLTPIPTAFSPPEIQ